MSKHVQVDRVDYDLPTRPAATEFLVDTKPRLPTERRPRFDSPIARRFSPRRNRWRDVADFDQRAHEFEQRTPR